MLFKLDVFVVYDKALNVRAIVIMAVPQFWYRNEAKPITSNCCE